MTDTASTDGGAAPEAGATDAVSEALGDGGSAGSPSFAETLSVENREWIGSKGGFETGDDAIARVRDLEQFRGAPADRLVTIPENADDADGWGKVYEKMGRPEAPEGYEIQRPEDVEESAWDQPRLDEMAKVFHDKGLNKEQAQALVNAEMGYRKALGEQQARQEESDIANLTETMMNEWGGQYETQRALAVAGAKLAQEDEKTDINDLLGSAPAMRFWAKLGAMQAEGTMPADAQPGGGGNAQSEIATIEKSTEWQAMVGKPKYQWTEDEVALDGKRRGLFEQG